MINISQVPTMRTFAATILLNISVSTGLAAEDADAANNIASGLEAMGLKQTIELRPGICKVTVNTNQTEALNAVPLLQKLDMFNDDLSKNDLLKTPTRTSMVISIQMAAFQVKDFYDKNATADKCSFVHNLISDDEYGNSRKELMFSYSFDRDLYRKINWDKFSSQNLTKVTKSFKFGPDVAIRMRSE